MDAAAYLKRHGWRGTGHSLDHTDRGIVKPLQISKKVDALGVGIQKYAAVSDQWWLRAYDQGLKELGTGKESALATAQKHGVNRGGLYARFVKGQDIPGTIGEDVAQSMAVSVIDDQRLRQAGETRAEKSKSLKRKKADEGNLPLQKKRATYDKEPALESTTVAITTERPLDIKRQIRAYVDEATRRGIVSDSNEPKSRRTKVLVPSEEDMQAVLRLAKLHKVKKPPQQLVERERLVRKLKRAACKYLETQMLTAPS